jgi:hypothetical protein
MKTNPLTQPKVALIDDEDHPALQQPKWIEAVASGRDYAQRHGSEVAIFPATFTIPKRPRSNMAGHCETIRQLGDTKSFAGEVRRRK